jgi:DNA-binding LacI/PurR family transcriptional regulator
MAYAPKNGAAVLTAATSGFVAVVMPLLENPAPVDTPDFGEAPPALQ